jgi:NAD(P)H-dependent FMN reductase
MTIQTLTFSGSLRQGSFNSKLVKFSATKIESMGIQNLTLEINAFPMPLFNEDDETENGAPASASLLREHFAESDLLLIASPEYNGSLTAVLKNTIDWLSRPSASKDNQTLSAFDGKVVLLLSASPGGLGGMRGLAHLRDILSNLGAIVLPGSVSISAAHNAFDEKGALKSDTLHGKLTKQIEKAVKLTQHLKAGVESL